MVGGAADLATHRALDPTQGRSTARPRPNQEAARPKLVEMFGSFSLGRYERLLEEREGGKRSPDSAAASPDPRVIEREAVEVKPAGERWWACLGPQRAGAEGQVV